MNDQFPDEVTPLKQSKNPAPTYIALSIILFTLSKSILRQLAPQKAKIQGPVTVWKWVNTANSLFHSVVTGIGAVACIITHPQTVSNVISTYSDFSHRLVCYSVGYFIFDIGDMLVNHRKRSSYELILHHVFVLSCFTLSALTRYYLPFTIISLLVELNSIPLHTRQLLIITHTPKHSKTYKTISTLNIATFILFRIATLAWMARWMVNNSELVDTGPYALGIVSIFGLVVMSFVLLVRLVRVDWFGGRGKGNNKFDNNNK